MVFALFFYVGGIISFTLLSLAVYVHHKHQGYNLKYNQLSYTGNKVAFSHPHYDKTFDKSYNHWFFTLSFILGGIFFLIGFLTVETVLLKITGVFYSICIIFIGVWDVGTAYKKHRKVIKYSQISYLTIVIAILVSNFSVLTMIAASFIIGLLLHFYYTRNQNIKNYDPKRSTISQRIFVFMELIFIGLLPIWLG